MANAEQLKFDFITLFTRLCSIANLSPVDLPKWSASTKALSIARHRMATLFFSSGRGLKSELYDVKNALEQKDMEYKALREAADTQAAKIAQNSYRYIPTEVKNAVLERDGWQCVIYGATAGLHFDHILPLSKGGGNQVENIQLLCIDCNLKKGNKIM